MPTPCVHLFLGGHILHTASLNRTGARNFALTSLLWTKDAAFYPCSAADARMIRQDRNSLNTHRAFEAMFAETPALGARAAESLARYDPTDVQAEVLVFDTIAPNHVTGAIFSDFEDLPDGAICWAPAMSQSTGTGQACSACEASCGRKKRTDSMAVRPVFMPVSEGRVLVRTAMVEFTWHAGLAASQKQKSIASLHAAAQNSLGVSPILEVFSKSLDPLGMALNAFNLCPSSSAGGAVGQRGMRVQAAKVFREGGPYCDLLNTIARNAKRDPRLRSSGDLVAFRFAGQDWPLEPQTAFYDWLYVQALHRRPELTAPVMAHRAFTDIEFNPQVSINCQAYSVALCVALAGRGIHDDALASRDAFLACVASKPVTTARQDDERQGFLF